MALAGTAPSWLTRAAYADAKREKVLVAIFQRGAMDGLNAVIIVWAMFALGADVAGGTVHGQWPGLEIERRYEHRDLAVTTGFRDVLASVIQHHAHTADRAKIFPGHDARPLPVFRTIP